jgi:hypothetical protein
MSDPQLNAGERRVQPRFIFALAAATLACALAALAGDSVKDLPDRQPMADRVVAVRFEAVPLQQRRAGPLRIAGAWTVQARDPRFGGLSALAVGSGGLVALTDSGVVIDLPRPGSGNSIRLRDLPAGPGYATYKKYRDSESLVIDRTGMWIGFENRHSLWRFTPGGATGTPLPGRTWPRNGGIEAMVRDSDGALLLLPEDAREVLRFADGRVSARLPLEGVTGGVADATRLPDGRVVVAVREIGFGLTNRLAWLERAGRGYRLRPFATLPLGLLDNIEGLTAEPLPNGGTRLWAVTDNDGWRRTLLLALDLPPERPGEKA